MESDIVSMKDVALELKARLLFHILLLSEYEMSDAPFLPGE